jgi:hypothetical protein
MRHTQHDIDNSLSYDPHHSAWLDHDHYGAAFIGSDGHHQLYVFTADAWNTTMQTPPTDGTTTAYLRVLTAYPHHEKPGRLPQRTRALLWPCTGTRSNGGRCKLPALDHTDRCQHHPHPATP